MAKHGQRGADIGGMVGARLRPDTEVGTEEGGAEFGNKLFPRIRLVAETLAEFASASMAYET